MAMSEAGLYPASWSDFIGQEQVKRQLLTAIASAKVRGVPLEHVLLANGTPGIGKTALAQLVINELGVRYRVQSGVVRPDDLLMLFQGMEDGDVLLLEEVHRLADGGKRHSEWLLHYLQDGMLITPLGPQDAPRCTVVATTTDAGKLPSPVRQRFQIVPDLQSYSDDEGRRIAERMAGVLLPPEGLAMPSEATAAAIARAGDNQPRIIRRILGHVRDLALSGQIEACPDYDLTVALEWAGMTDDGLDAASVAYLQALFSNFGGRPAGRAILGNLIGEMGTSLADVERALISKGHIVLHGTAGRRLTRLGIDRAYALAQRAA